jgi:hypothetical protein
MRLKQGQVWKNETTYLRIVQLERLSVDFKIMDNAFTKDGTHKQLSKKEFCRLIKGATLVEEG